jgi:transcriptional regulator of acetoin/glycerol metabolism
MQQWTPQNLPQDLVEILDRKAGKVHSEEGSVRAALAEILNEYDLRQMSAVERELFDLAEAQRRTGALLHEAVRRANANGVSWSAMGRAIGLPRETLYRQFKHSTAINVVKVHQNPPKGQ